jgi:hypothetical protein
VSVFYEHIPGISYREGAGMGWELCQAPLFGERGGIGLTIRRYEQLTASVRVFVTEPSDNLSYLLTALKICVLYRTLSWDGVPLGPGASLDVFSSAVIL